MAPANRQTDDTLVMLRVLDNGRRTWWAYQPGQRRSLHGHKGESKQALARRFARKFGCEIKRITYDPTPSRPSAAAMTIATDDREASRD